MGTPADRPRPLWPAAVLVGALSAALGLVTLGHKSLWYDEAYDAVHAHEPLGSLLHRIGATEMSQAAYLLGLKPWLWLAPDTEAWLRLPSVAFAALAAALAVPLGARLFDRTTGVVAGALLATNALLVSWSQQARTYALATAAVVVTAVLLLRALDHPTRRAWLLYAAACALAVYCHFWAGLVVAAEIVSLAFAPRRPPRRLLAESAAAFLALSAVALSFTATAGRDQLRWIFEPTPDRLRRIVTGAAGENRLLLLAALAGVVLLGRRLAQRRERRSEEAFRFVLVAGWIVLPFVLALAISLTTQPILVHRYAIVVTPGIALAAAVAVVALVRVHRTVAVAALALVVALSLLQVGRWYRREGEDWRGAVAYASMLGRDGTPIVVAPYWSMEPVLFYNGLRPVGTRRVEGRSAVIVRVSPDATADGLIDAVYGSGRWRAAGERRFGRLHVVTVESR